MSRYGDFHFGFSDFNRSRRVIINRFANPSTQQFLLDSGLSPGMKVLDLTCGIGLMTSWIASKVGEAGEVVAVDDSDDQLLIAREIAQENNQQHVKFVNLTVQDLLSLEQKFDVIYCRYMLVHLDDPLPVLQTIYELLNKDGVFVCESAIIGHEFCYPENSGFEAWRKLNRDLFKETNRDPDAGKKLYYYMHSIGFNGLQSRLVQPVIATADERREMLIQDLQDQQKAMIEAGVTTEYEIAEIISELEPIIDDPSFFVAYTQSAQVAGYK